MARIIFTSHLRGVAPREAVETDGPTIGAALEAVWAQHPRLRSYLVDEQGHLRRHIAVFLDGQLLKSPMRAPINRASQIHIMQALSGG